MRLKFIKKTAELFRDRGDDAPFLGCKDHFPGDATGF